MHLDDLVFGRGPPEVTLSIYFAQSFCQLSPMVSAFVVVVYLESISEFIFTLANIFADILSVSQIPAVVALVQRDNVFGALLGVGMVKVGRVTFGLH
ncbi:hypothetical protein BD410DRAFT_387597 [Rickenella mellea]|uniref:Uncharacterized protein n=1 Tax=Rickenella mellea TaxID=50990 RepID=A0A4Y7PZM6_9AGAM|nr:hypothetical protein BD410DRAFT_387597 [Rickenella mellea]